MTAASVRRRYLFLIGLRWFQTGLLIPIFTLLMLSRGLTLVDIGIVGSIAGLVILVLELPTGGLSDALGRRPTLVLAYLFALGGLVALFLAQSLAGFVVSTVLTAIFRALDSGPLEAWFVDETHAVAPDTRIETGLAAGASVLSLAIAGGSLLAGALIAIDPIASVGTLDLPVLGALIVSVVNLGAVLVLMTETRHGRGSGAALAAVRAVPTVVREGIGLLRGSRILLALVAVELFWGIAVIAFETLFPIKLAEVVGGTTQAGALMGPVSAGAWFAAAAGAAGIVLVSRRTGVAVAALAMRILQGATVILMGLLTGAAGLVAAYLACYLLHGASNPMHTTLLHREVTATHRTTVLSLNSMVFHPAAAVGSVMLTAVAAGSSVSAAIVLGGVVCALAAPLYLPARRAERDRAAAVAQASVKVRSPEHCRGRR